MRLLVTGAQGWIGRFVMGRLAAGPAAGEGLWRVAPSPGFARWAASAPAIEAFGLGRGAAAAGFSDGSPLPAGLARTDHPYFAIDLGDPEATAALLAELRPDVVLHLAGATHTAPPHHFDAQNRGATCNLLRAMAAARPGARMVMGSTGSVYGTVLRAPQDEDHPCEATTAYARSKRTAELAGATVAAELGLGFVAARIFNVVGPGQPAAYLPGALARQLAAILTQGAPARLEVGPLSSTRDYVDVRDVADMLLAIAGSPFEGPINLGSGVETPVQAVWDTLVGLAIERGSPPPILSQLPPRPADVPRQVAGLAQLAALDLVPRRSLRDSLSDLLDDLCMSARMGALHV